MIDRNLYRQIPIHSLRVTLCGSTKFREAFDFWNTHLTLAGNAVYSVAVDAHGEARDALPTEEEKTLLDEVHLMKIKNSDAIFVLDVDGYIGSSTAREIVFARAKGKDVYYLSKMFPSMARRSA
jgi:nucleoside 2-deoxyribosyltransferase